MEAKDLYFFGGGKGVSISSKICYIKGKLKEIAEKGEY